MAAQGLPLTFEEAFGTPERGDIDEEYIENALDALEHDEDEHEHVNHDEDDNEHEHVINDVPVSLRTIRDNIISPKTLRAYTSDLVQFLQWVHTNENHWLTEHGNEELTALYVQQEHENARQHRTRKQRGVATLLRNAYQEPIVHLERIVPSQYMNYLLTLRRDNHFLSKSAYGSKRAALFHLFRLHNRVGFQDGFKIELSNLLKGLFRQVASRRNVINNNGEGKELMSIELYKFLCETFLKYGTMDGIFAHCYLVLSWNLACRCNNTARITFADIRWSHSFDSFSISFSQSKTDQLGEEAKYPRHIYSNPVTPLVCPVLAVALYLTTCFGNNDVPEMFFPGRSQDARFTAILQRTINEKWEDISQMGYRRGEIGTHSIRKGAVSYMASLPGGPSVASVCTRAGWTMGKVKDIYMRYVTSGDEFVGRCLSLMPLLSTQFASSPPYFEDEQVEWVDTLRRRHFKRIALVDGMEKLTRMCLASILYHYEWLVNVLGRNHTFLVSSVIHRSDGVEQFRASVQVSYPWNDNINHYSGIPPHVTVLQDMAMLKNTQEQLLRDQQQLVGDFVTQTRILLADGGRLADREYMRDMLDQFHRDFDTRFNAIMRMVPNQEVPQPNQNAGRAEEGHVYTLHYYLGAYKRVPQDWRFPRCSVFQLWRQWWIGDTVNNVPPLRHLEISDINHLDDVPLSAVELHGRKGRYREQRRKTSKLLSDMKFLMGYMKRILQERNLYRAETTLESVDAMFQSVSDLFEGNRPGQINWLTAVNKLRYTQRNIARAMDQLVDID
jgi:hypothetical protein